MTERLRSLYRFLYSEQIYLRREANLRGETKVQCLVRNTHSGIYYARARVNGKLLWKTLEGTGAVSGAVQGWDALWPAAPTANRNVIEILFILPPRIALHFRIFRHPVVTEGMNA